MIPVVKEQIPFILGILIFGVYLSTLSPVVYLGDSGEFTTAAFSFGIPHSSGYPLYSIIGKLFCMIPLGNIGFRMNLMSSFFAAFTVSIVYLLILKITFSCIAGFFGALILAFLPLFWSQTVAAEVYTLHAFFVVLLIYLLWKWDETRDFTYLLTAAFLAGISFCNHLQTLMLAPAVLFIIYSTEKKVFLKGKNFLILSLFFILGLSLYIYLPIRSGTGVTLQWGDVSNLEGFLSHVTGKGHRGFYVFTQNFPAYVLRCKEVLYLIWKQFGLILLLSLWGWLKLPSVRWKIFVILLILFDLFYTLFLNIISLEISPFELPTCVILSILSGIGLSEALRIIFKKPFISRQTRVAIATICCLIPLLFAFFNYKQCDQSKNYTAYDNAVNILRTPESGSTIIMDGDNIIFPVTYGRMVERMREDITLYDRHNLFFKMPYLGNSKDPYIYYGKWEDLRGMLEKKIIEKKVDMGVFFAVLDPNEISVTVQNKIIPFGILRQIIHKEGKIKPEMLINIWKYYSDDCFYEDFQRDYMTREVTSFYYFAKGEHYLIKGENAVGLGYMRVASDIGYNDNNIHSNIAIALINNGFFKEAKIELEKAFSYNSNSDSVYNNWGYFYYKTGDVEKAIEAFKRAIELNPEAYQYYNNLAFLYIEIGEKNEAREMFEKSIEINHEQKEIKKQLEKSLNNNG